MTLKQVQANLKNCIYCGACFRYCSLNVFNELDGDELKRLVAGVTRIAKKGYDEEKDKEIKDLFDRCTLEGYCDKVCPAMVNPFSRNQIAKKNMGEIK